jgi:hypothetical protein
MKETLKEVRWKGSLRNNEWRLHRPVKEQSLIATFVFFFHQKKIKREHLGTWPTQQLIKAIA